MPAHFRIRAATLSGRLRRCPICDGYEVADRNVAVLSTAEAGADHSLFLRTYTSRLTLLVEPGGGKVDASHRHSLFAAGIRLREEAIVSIEVTGAGVVVLLEGGEALCFVVMYPLLGSDARDTLGTRLGA